MPRLLTIMGSGETAPTMVKVHRTVKDMLGPKRRRACCSTPLTVSSATPTIFPLGPSRTSATASAWP